jgi:hypothetical protein
MSGLLRFVSAAEASHRVVESHAPRPQKAGNTEKQKNRSANDALALCHDRTPT